MDFMPIYFAFLNDVFFIVSRDRPLFILRCCYNCAICIISVSPDEKKIDKLSMIVELDPEIRFDFKESYQSLLSTWLGDFIIKLNNNHLLL